jgi:hypothetical protein
MSITTCLLQVLAVHDHTTVAPLSLYSPRLDRAWRIKLDSHSMAILQGTSPLVKLLHALLSSRAMHLGQRRL